MSLNKGLRQAIFNNRFRLIGKNNFITRLFPPPTFFFNFLRLHQIHESLIRDELLVDFMGFNNFLFNYYFSHQIIKPLFSSFLFQDTTNESGSHLVLHGGGEGEERYPRNEWENLYPTTKFLL